MCFSDPKKFPKKFPLRKRNHFTMILDLLPEEEAIKVALELPLKDIEAYCASSKNVSRICGDTFWQRRYNFDFYNTDFNQSIGKPFRERIPKESWKDYYMARRNRYMISSERLNQVPTIALDEYQAPKKEDKPLPLTPLHLHHLLKEFFVEDEFAVDLDNDEESVYYAPMKLIILTNKNRVMVFFVNDFYEQPQQGLRKSRIISSAIYDITSIPGIKVFMRVWRSTDGIFTQTNDGLFEIKLIDEKQTRIIALEDLDDILILSDSEVKAVEIGVRVKGKTEHVTVPIVHLDIVDPADVEEGEDPLLTSVIVTKMSAKENVRNLSWGLHVRRNLDDFLVDLFETKAPIKKIRAIEYPGDGFIIVILDMYGELYYYDITLKTANGRTALNLKSKGVIRAKWPDSNGEERELGSIKDMGLDVLHESLRFNVPAQFGQFNIGLRAIDQSGVSWLIFFRVEEDSVIFSAYRNFLLPMNLQYTAVLSDIGQYYATTDGMVVHIFGDVDLDINVRFSEYHLQTFNLLTAMTMQVVETTGEKTDKKDLVSNLNIETAFDMPDIYTTLNSVRSIGLTANGEIIGSLGIRNENAVILRFYPISVAMDGSTIPSYSITDRPLEELIPNGGTSYWWNNQVGVKMPNVRIIQNQTIADGVDIIKTFVVRFTDVITTFTQPSRNYVLGNLKFVYSSIFIVDPNKIAPPVNHLTHYEYRNRVSRLLDRVYLINEIDQQTNSRRFYNTSDEESEAHKAVPLHYRTSSFIYHNIIDDKYVVVEGYYSNELRGFVTPMN